MKLARIIALFLLILLVFGGAVRPINAQIETLTQLATSLDGTISVRLPADWITQDTATSIFTSAFAFGDSAESLQELMGTLVGTPPALTTPHLNGLIGIIDTRLTSGLPTQVAITSLMQGIIQDLTPQGGRVLEQQSLMLGDRYTASLIVVEISARSAKGFVVVFETPNGIAEVSLGAVPQRNFDSNRAQLEAILNSIRIPAEEALPGQPPRTEPNPITLPVEQSGGLVRSGRDQFSVHLPDAWTSQNISVEAFLDVLTFGSTQAAADVITGLIVEGGEIGTFAGVGGLIGVVDTSQMNPAQVTEALIAPLMQQMLTSIGNGGGVQVVDEPSAHTFGDGYPGQLALTNIGYLGTLFADHQLVVMIILSDNLDANQAQMLAVMDSIRVPAETTAFAEVPVRELLTIRAAQDVLSLDLPDGWVTLDHGAQNAFAFGDSEQAAQTRLASANPDLAEGGTITGLGGLILLYDAAALNLDPAQPDLNSLMDRVLSSLEAQGYRVLQAAQPVTLGTGSGLMVQIVGTEQGYLALVAFGNQIAYITATGTPDIFAQNDVLLRDILHSIRVPAADVGGGLGGLGGLGGDTTPAPPGLGGL